MTEDVIRDIMSSPDRRDAVRGMTISERDEYFMSVAMAIARACAHDGEVPVGAVIVRDGVIVSCGANGREREKNALSHAETNAINAACLSLGGWRLTGTVLYATLEPCTMCAGAIINAHIPRVVFAARDASAGAMGSVIRTQSLPLGFKPSVRICEKFSRESAAMLREFFTERRKCKDAP
jgi:tRNA(adenine34) deaminase